MGLGDVFKVNENKQIKDFDDAKQLNPSVKFFLCEYDKPNLQKDDEATFYHVSSYITENYIFKKESKPYLDWCNLISSCDVSSPSKCKMLLTEINKLESKEEEKYRRGELKWLCEAIFEYVRRTEFPDNPSRVWGVFVTRTYIEAYRFNSRCRKGAAKIFEIVYPNQKVFEYDMEKFDIACNSLKKDELNDGLLNRAFKQARLYWGSKEDDKKACPECIIDGSNDIVVGRQIISKPYREISDDEIQLLDYYNRFNASVKGHA